MTTTNTREVLMVMVGIVTLACTVVRCLHSGGTMKEITLTIIIYLRCKDSSFITRHRDQVGSRQNSYETCHIDDGMKGDDRVKNYFD